MIKGFTILYRSLKGVDRNVLMSVEEYRKCLYDPDVQVNRSYHKLEFVRSTGTICNIKISKKALNSAYSKLRTSDLVQCYSWD